MLNVVVVSPESPTSLIIGKLSPFKTILSTWATYPLRFILILRQRPDTV